jgi:DMSO/TMAO reductase YedYZ heme-binding membrane subunit
MNAHLTHSTHWLHDIGHSFSEELHNPTVWKIAGVAAFIGLLMLLFVFAASFSGSGNVSYYYGYPAYPMVP